MPPFKRARSLDENAIALPPAPTMSRVGVISNKINSIVGLNRYELDTTEIGSGAFGIVRRAYDKGTCQTVAIKTIKDKSTASEGISGLVLTEIGALNALDHPNIVKLYSTHHVNDSTHLVFEYVQLTLKYFITEKPAATLDGQLLRKSNIRLIMHQLLDAVAYMHGCGFMHCDLKPSNILLTTSPQLSVKIADFGQCRQFDFTGKRHHPTPVQTLWWRSPEVLMGDSKYTQAVDMWSLGCIFAELMTGTHLLPGESDGGQLLEVFQFVGTPTEVTWPGFMQLPDYSAALPKFKGTCDMTFALLIAGNGLAAVDLLRKLLTANPKTRITAKEALQHEYFTKGSMELV